MLPRTVGQGKASGREKIKKEVAPVVGEKEEEAEEEEGKEELTSQSEAVISGVCT